MFRDALNSMAPLLLAALGGLLTELAGVLNIALEGMMLAGAFAAIIVTDLTGSLAAGAAAAVAAGFLTALVFGFSSFTLKGNIFITGLGINVLVPALIASFSQRLYGNQGIIRPEQIDHLPSAGGTDIFTWSALLLAGTVFLILYRTAPGLKLRAAGDQPDLLKSRGIRPERIQKYAVYLSGILAGLAGASLSLRLGVFVPGMSAGKGWIALVAIYLGYRRIPGIAAACLFFSLAEIIANRAQGLLSIPPSLILGFPYFFTLLGLWLFSLWNKRRS